MKKNSLATVCRTITLHYIITNNELQIFVIGRLEDLPGEFCGEEPGEQRGEKLKPG